ncbi:hypothetical protein HPG69_000244 [Diceros bicornis minor]|uniref:Maturase K n=1 Tax=Diceros bicornis minor TaxID=77932 RepID=A0A7J7EVC5_DICBM|nr:hypothetical protein HPG69_000244 [Diceros bicornis minor]
MFEPYLRSFYIGSTNSIQIKILKLEMLINLVNETNILTILREFQTYIRSMDRTLWQPRSRPLDAVQLI